MKQILRVTDEVGRAELGGKGWALASAQRAGMPVPPWFAVSSCTSFEKEEEYGERVRLNQRGQERTALE